MERECDARVSAGVESFCVVAVQHSVVVQSRMSSAVTRRET